MALADAIPPRGAAIGSCYGFAVASPLPLRYLRPGGHADRSLDVVPGAVAGPTSGELVFRWDVGPDQPVSARLYRSTPSRFRLYIGQDAYDVDTSAPAVTIDAERALRGEERLWGLPALLCFAARGDVALHGATVQVGGRAVLLGGPSHAGKTTLAAAMYGAGHGLLGEDLACVRLGDPPVVWPGPAMLRIRHDIDALVEPADTLPLAVRDGRVHRALAPGRRGDGAPVEVAAIVLLHWDDGPVRLERLDPAEALRDVWSLAFRLPGAQEARSCFTRLADLLRQVPVWALRRPRRFEALPEVIDRIARSCS